MEPNEIHSTRCSPLPHDAVLPATPLITPKTSIGEAWVTECADPYACPYNPRQQREKTWWEQTKTSFTDKENNKPNMVSHNQQHQ
eukprot:14500423-Ditylum_brightwellii.AAC.1